MGKFKKRASFTEKSGPSIKPITKTVGEKKSPSVNKSAREIGFLKKKSVKFVRGEGLEGTVGDKINEVENKSIITSSNVNPSPSASQKRKRNRKRKASSSSDGKNVSGSDETQGQMKTGDSTKNDSQKDPSAFKAKKSKRRRKSNKHTVSVNEVSEGKQDPKENLSGKKEENPMKVAQVSSKMEHSNEWRQMLKKKLEENEKSIINCEWPFVPYGGNTDLSLEKFGSADVVNKLIHLNKHTKVFEKMEHLFVDNRSLNAGLEEYDGWCLRKLLKFLDDTRFFLDNFFEGDNEREVPWKQVRRLYSEKYSSSLFEKIVQSCPKPTLKQSLNYAKIFLMKQLPKDELKQLQHRKLPKPVKGDLHILEEKILELTGVKPEIPMQYLYQALWSVPKIGIKNTSNERLKEFYIALADFFCKKRKMLPMKEDSPYQKII